LRDLNHLSISDFKRVVFPKAHLQAGTASSSTATRCRDVGRGLTGLDFDIRAPGKFGRGNLRCAPRRSQCSAAQRAAVKDGASTVASGVLRDTRPLHHSRNSLQKRKLCAVALAPICGQQIGQMRA
jgi:hypothetical protein